MLCMWHFFGKAPATIILRHFQHDRWKSSKLLSFLWEHHVLPMELHREPLSSDKYNNRPTLLNLFICSVVAHREARSTRSPPSTARQSQPSSSSSPLCPSCALLACCWPPLWCTACATAPTTSSKRSSPIWEQIQPAMLPPPTR